MRRFARLAFLAACAIGLSAAVPAAAQNQVSLIGVVRDSSGAVVARADVSLLTSEQTVLKATKTDDRGRFEIAGVPAGRYLLTVVFPGFSERRVAVTAGGAEGQPIDVALEPEGVRSEVTVTANRGLIQDARLLTQPVNVIDAREIEERAKVVVGEVATEEPGVQLLRTSPVMSGIYVRGLTGNKVNVFIDGVRYSTASARGGVNTFLDLIEPTNLDSAEILRGPTASQYGSDAIGGSVQFLSGVPSFASPGSRAAHGAVNIRLTSGDDSVGSNANFGYSGATWGLFVNGAARGVGSFRPGKGIDSHAAVTRFLGLPSNELMDSRLPDTSWSQVSGLVKFNWAATPRDQIVGYYARSQQPNGKRYDQLLGGDGNLIADLKDLTSDLDYVKYNRVGFGFFDLLTATYSYNAQREERINQGGNGNPKSSITHEYEKTMVNGFQAHATKQWGTRYSLVVGGEYYPERVDAPSYSEDPVTGTTAVRRGRIPDKARYKSGGAYAQTTYEIVPNVVKLVGNLRYSGASYVSKASDSPLVNGQPLWPDDSLTAAAFAYRVGAVATASDRWSLSGNISRGFRAPHVTDLGTVGLTGSGYQVSATTVEGMGATVGSTAGANAVSTGQPVEQVTPETSLSYEAGVHYRDKRFSTDLAVFLNDVYDNIAYQALILPQGAVGKQLGDQTITAQNANGVVYVPASSSPVLVRTNFGDARVTGLEHTFDWRVNASWSAGTVFTYMRAKDKATGLPPNIEGGTPAPELYLKVRYVAPGGRYWIVPYIHIAAEQTRLSSLDLEDRRTGATRTRSNIKNFFYNGATVRGWVASGPDGIFGNADDVLIVTGETLAQVQNRVLGAGVTSAPLYTSVKGYTTVSVRGGVRIRNRHELTFDLVNLGDVNYRGIAWGIDAMGRSISVAYQVRF